ncbi:hypothetical protein RM528_34830, partial [Streptomyces sp. DSM 41635]|nr:hypothetical protein [Streptomyces sp. DSM 41635]
VKEICQRYGLPYNTGPIHKQFASVVRKIVRLAFPWGGTPKDPEPEVNEPAPEPASRPICEPELVNC